MLRKNEEDASPLRRFFRVLMPGFSRKLLLPRAFVKQLMNERCRKRKATLTNPNGNSWRVDVHKDSTEEDMMQFGGAGWVQFIHEHDLRFGFFLVFCYEGDMAFNFRAYDTTTCEIVYPSIEKKIVAQTQIEPRYHKNSILSKRSTPRCIISFKCKIGRCSLLHSYLNIPREALRECSQLSQQNELTLIDPNRREWPVHLYHRWAKRWIGSHITRGWKDFALGNKLKVDDICVFELISKTTMTVQINPQRRGS